MRTTFTLALALLLTTAGAASAQPFTDADLAGKKFMHRGSFAADDGYSWARDDIELEAAYTVHNVPGAMLYKLLRQDEGSGQPLRGDLFEDDNVFREVRKQPIVEAFAIGYPVDEVPWDAERHAIREANPYIWLTIESGNYDLDERRNERRVSLGTDLMDDVYYDTDDYLLLRNAMTVRGRKRYDSIDSMRRLLIATKAEGGVDEFGIKRAAKVDVREDGPDAAAIEGLDDMVRSGLVTWSGSPAVAAPCRELYRRLLARGADLPDTATYQDVLLLQPKAFIRSLRSRYHLNEVRLDAVRAVHDLGRKRLETLLAMARESRMDGAVPAEHEAAVRAWEDQARRVLDGSLVLERAEAGLRALDPTMTVDAAAITSLVPTAPLLAATRTIDEIAAREVELKKRRVVAEALSALYHEVAAALDDGSAQSLRRVITRALDRAREDHAEWYEEHLRARDPKTYGPLTTHDRFVETLRDAIGLPDAERAAALEAYNAFGRERRAAGVRKFRRFEPLPADALDALLRQLVNEQVRLWMRQLEAAGTAGLGLWFDQARAFYIPGSYRSSGNFLIDTMDFTSMYPMTVWDGVPPAERTAAKTLPEDQLLNCVLVNEVQIELTSVSAYTDRLRRLGGGLALARGLMRWGEQTGHPALAGGSDAAAFTALHGAVTALPQAEREAAVAAINSLVGGGAAHSVEDLQALDTTLLTPAVRDGETPPALAVALDGAKFIFEQYHRMQTYVATIKGERVIDVLRDAGGPDGMVWAPSPSSKGEMAISAVRAREGGDTGGLAGGIATAGSLAAPNATKAGALTLERKKYPEARLPAGETRWFRLELGPGQGATFTATFSHAEGDVDLVLEAEDGSRLRTSTGTGDRERIRYWSGGGRTVYLRVSTKHGAASGPFVLEVR